jgi:hypothetical protein
VTEPHLIGEFEREDYTFTVLRDGKVHRIEVRKGNAAEVLVGHVYDLYRSPDWSRSWHIDAWKPWIEQEARLIIAESQPTDDGSVNTAAAQPHRISE